MQVSEKLVRQVVETVLSELENTKGSSKENAKEKGSAGENRERINAVKTDYSSYPRAEQRSDPKEVVIGVGAAFQREIKKTICGIPLDEVIRNVKAGIEEEGMHPRVVKVLDTSDVCFMALEAAKLLAAEGIEITVINMHTIKPLDAECVVKYAEKCGNVITVEEHSVIGGLGDAVADALMGKVCCKFKKIGINDQFGQSGKAADVLREYGLTADQIAAKIKETL